MGHIRRQLGPKFWGWDKHWGGPWGWLEELGLGLGLTMGLGFLFPFWGNGEQGMLCLPGDVLAVGDIRCHLRPLFLLNPPLWGTKFLFFLILLCCWVPWAWRDPVVCLGVPLSPLGGFTVPH